MPEDDKSPVHLAVDRIDQMMAMLREEREALRAEREVYRMATESMLRHLDTMRDHWNLAQRVSSSLVRLEGNLREGVGEAHRLVDKLPGRRMQ